MQPIILGLIVFLVVSLLGVGLFYVGTKFFFNVSNDVSNANITSTANKDPNLPTLKTSPHSHVQPSQPTIIITNPIQPNKLESWSQVGYQGNLLDSISLNFPTPYSDSGIINLNNLTQSIRYIPGIYDIYYIISTLIPSSKDDINIPLSPDTTNISIPSGKQLFIVIKNTLTTTSTMATIPPPTQPSTDLNVYNFSNNLINSYSLLSASYTVAISIDLFSISTAAVSINFSSNYIVNHIDANTFRNMENSLNITRAYSMIKSIPFKYGTRVNSSDTLSNPGVLVIHSVV